MKPAEKQSIVVVHLKVGFIVMYIKQKYITVCEMFFPIHFT